jgi:uncharacterized phage protein gp47/JayE
MDTCGCCQPGAPASPELISNRPGLSQIGYRVGTYASFVEAMEEDISKAPELLRWTARGTDDYGIAVLHLFAYVADVLTFYQERVANEAYLRTALLPESLRRLAVTLGYVPTPAVAASTALAFRLEDSATLTIPAGFQIRSVPGPGQKPQPFETISDLNARSELNQVAAFGPLDSASPLDPKSTVGFLRPSNASTVPPMRPGATLVMWNSAAVVEDKVVIAITSQGPLVRVNWDPAIQQNGLSNARRYKRKLRLFGYNAPPTFVYQYTTDAGEIRFVIIPANTTVMPPGSSTPVSYDLSLPAATQLDLDSVYDDLRVGTHLLLPVRSARQTVVGTITAVQHVARSLGPVTGTVTRVTLDQSTPAIDDVRQFELYELDSPDLPFLTSIYPDSFTGTRILVPLDQLSTLETNRQVVVMGTSPTGDLVGHLASVVAVTPVGPTNDGVKDHWQIDFTPGLADSVEGWTASLSGNVVGATHGESVAGERLGAGDATASNQTFQLRKSPLTYVHLAGAPHGAASTLAVQVNGVLWSEIANFYTALPGDRAFTTRIDDDGTVTIEFGDGNAGARLGTSAPVMANYRVGAGQGGNLPAGTLTSLSQRPVGLKAATNPIPASGGDDGEQREQIRLNAPNSVRTLGRIVSLRDFEDAAREHAGIRKAQASWHWNNYEQVVRLVVAGVGGAHLTDLDQADLLLDLDSRRDTNRTLLMADYTKVPVVVQATILAAVPGYAAADVRAAAERALSDLFAFDNRDFGQPVHLSDVYAAIQQATGVMGVDITRLQYESLADRNAHQATNEPVLDHIWLQTDEIASLSSQSGVTGP